jgi:hypothetical protein
MPKELNAMLPAINLLNAAVDADQDRRGDYDL